MRQRCIPDFRTCASSSRWISFERFLSLNFVRRPSRRSRASSMHGHMRWITTATNAGSSLADFPSPIACMHRSFRVSGRTAYAFQKLCKAIAIGCSRFLRCSNGGRPRNGKSIPDLPSSAGFARRPFQFADLGKITRSTWVQRYRQGGCRRVGANRLRCAVAAAECFVVRRIE